MSNQCEGKSKSGVRCTKRTRDESKRCHFHRGSEMYNQETVVVIRKKKSGHMMTEETTTIDLVEQSCTKIDCCVCMEEMPVSDKLDCGHPLCRGCLGQLRNDKCPMCRREIKAKHIKSKDKKKMRDRLDQDRVARHNQGLQQFLDYQIIQL